MYTQDIENQVIENVKLLLADAYESLQTYVTGDITSAGGIFYRSLEDANLGNEPSGWPSKWTPVLDLSASIFRGRPKVSAETFPRIYVYDTGKLEDAFGTDNGNSGVYNAEVMVQCQTYADDDVDETQLDLLAECVRHCLLRTNVQELLDWFVPNDVTLTWYDFRCNQSFREHRDGIRMANFNFSCSFSPTT